MVPVAASAPTVANGFPLWVQIAILGFIGLGVMVGAGYVYVKKNAPPERKDEGVVLSATLADARAVRELIDATHQLRNEICDSRERRHRDSIAERDCCESNTEAMKDLSEAVKQAPPVSPIHPDFGALLARLDRLERDRPQGK